MPRFFPGQKVVCLDSGVSDDDAKPEGLKARRIYTVRSVSVESKTSGRETINLVEIKRDVNAYGDEIGYWAHRFALKEYAPIHLIIARPVDDPERAEIFAHAETEEMGNTMVDYLNRTSQTYRYLLMPVPPISPSLRLAWGETLSG
jgi:hypothetical protein